MSNDVIRSIGIFAFLMSFSAGLIFYVTELVKGVAQASSTFYTLGLITIIAWTALTWKRK